MANLYTHPLLTYNLGFKIGQTTLPDPTAFNGSEADLDTLGERDANGGLHRNKVAMKHPMQIQWENIPWNAVVLLCQQMTSASFSFTFPDPFSASNTRTITAYAGDRKFSAVRMAGARVEYLASLSVSIIEY